MAANTFGNIFRVTTFGESHGLIINGEFKKVDGAQKIWDFTRNGDLTYAKKNDKIGLGWHMTNSSFSQVILKIGSCIKKPLPAI